MKKEINLDSQINRKNGGNNQNIHLVGIPILALSTSLNPFQEQAKYLSLKRASFY